MEHGLALGILIAYTLLLVISVTASMCNANMGWRPTWYLVLSLPIELATLILLIRLAFFQ